MSRPKDNQDKRAWCDTYGVAQESAWCEWARDALTLDVRINPAKDEDRFTFDLLLNGKPADLKTVRTPLYLARPMFGIDPQYAVTFNHKDGTRYRSLYPDITVIFDVAWDGTPYVAQDGERFAVRPMRLVALGSLDDVAHAVKEAGSQTLTYKYTDFETQAPQHHKTVAELRFRDKTDQEIASITGFRVAQVRRILAHAPVAQWVARMRLRLEELSREFDGKKYELASDAFEVQAAVVRGTEKVSRERLAAVLDAQKKDPAGRFNHYEEKSNKTKIVGTNDLREHIENARRRLAVDATVVQQLEEQPDEAGQTAAGN